MSLMQNIGSKLLARAKHSKMGLTDIITGLLYLKRYGYITDDIDVEDAGEAIATFQSIAGLITDGVMGPKTVRAMSKPRCSCPDFYKHDDGKLHMEVALSRWRGKNLTYYISKRDNDLSTLEWDAIIELAFNQWSDVADLHFTRVNSSRGANFIISVGSGRGDGFDGPSGTLAWAQLPSGNSFQGQLLCRFDTAETWVKDSTRRGIILLAVACHEIGHLLGLGHSRINNALMAPFYDPSVLKPVSRDDISRIVSLYGKATGTPTPPTPPDPTDPEPDPSLPAPSDLVATVMPTGNVLLRWQDNSIGEDRFEIFRSDDGWFKIQGSVGRGRTIATDQVIPDGTHEYKIRAVKGDVTSAWSNVVEVVTGDPTPQPPVPPKPDPPKPNPPTPDDPSETTITIVGDVTDIKIPGYRVNKIG